MTKVIEVINNVLSIASNKEIGLFIKLLIVLVVIVFFGVISFYKKKDSVIIGAIVVIIAILIVVVGEVRHCGEPGPSTPTPKATSTASATLTETPTAMMTETPTATIEKTDTEPAEISIQDANVLDDVFFMMEIWLNRMCMRMFMILMCGQLWVVLGLILRFKVRHIFYKANTIDLQGNYLCVKRIHLVIRLL